MVEVEGCGSAAGRDASRRVLIVEDHRLLADALALGLQGRGLPCRVAALGELPQVVEQAIEWRPTLVLLDLDLGVVDGLDLVDGMRSTGARVLVVSGCRDEGRLAAAVALGAVGWVSKSGPFEELLQAAELAARDQPLVTPTRREALAALGRRHLDSDLDLKSRMGLLTDREMQILGAMADGLSAQQMAERFVVSIGTIRSHIRAVLTKLGVSTQLAAVAMAQQLAASWRGRGEVASTLPQPVRGRASTAPTAAAAF